VTPYPIGKATTKGGRVVALGSHAGKLLARSKDY
jgi:hypothetical protein